MPRVRLAIRQVPTASRRSYFERDGALRPLRLYQLTALIRIGRPSPRGGRDECIIVPNAIVDTGAPLSSFPNETWKYFENQIEWLTLDEPDAPPGGPTVSIAGHRYPYRLGRIDVTVTDFEGRRLAPAPILALFLDEPHGMRPPPVLLGLTRGIFDGRRMLLGPSLDGLAGQDWWLEDG